MIDLAYSNLIDLIQPYKVEGRTESTAFLHWFLVNLYRLDPMDVEAIVCDGHGDKGIDGIYVNHNEGYIDVLQSKIVKRDTKTLGDVQLKEFIGSLSQLQTVDSIESLIDKTENSQLKNLLLENKQQLISSDFSIRGIFITNAEKDSNAINLLETLDNPSFLEVWDKSLISQMYVPSEKAIPATEELSFDVFGFDYSEYNIENVAKVVIAPLAATDLVKMEGIENQQIFDLNLRKGLGKTKVNKDIFRSIENQSEHNHFLLYHNGITMICGMLDTDEEGKIKIKDYSVVNGCQSVSCIYEKRHLVTDDLRILTRLIYIQAGYDKLISEITYNSNNQNGIKARDFRSNTATQVRLKEEIEADYQSFVYQIKTGENKKSEDIEGKTLIDNGLAGQILLAFDLSEPWRVQRPSKIFDEWHPEIFARPEVSGARIISLFKVYRKIEEELILIKPELFSRYQITKFFLLYLLKEVLVQDEVGKEFCARPQDFMASEESENKLLEAIHLVLADVIVDLNAEFKEKGELNYDWKATFKSPRLVRELKNDVLSAYQKVLNRGRVESFSQLLNQS